MHVAEVTRKWSEEPDNLMDLSITTLNEIDRWAERCGDELKLVYRVFALIARSNPELLHLNTRVASND